MQTKEVAVRGKVWSLHMVPPFLFVGQEVPTGQAAPGDKQGLIQAFNTTSAQNWELKMNAQTPFSHGTRVSCMVAKGQFLFSGGGMFPGEPATPDNAIRVWQLNPQTQQFAVAKTISSKMLDEEVAFPDGSSSRTTLAGKMDRSSSEVYSDEEVQQSQQVVRVGSFLPRPTGKSSAEVEELAKVADTEMAAGSQGHDVRETYRTSMEDEEREAQRRESTADLTYSQQRRGQNAHGCSCHQRPAIDAVICEPSRPTVSRGLEKLCTVVWVTDNRQSTQSSVSPRNLQSVEA